MRGDVARAWELVDASRYSDPAPLLSSLLTVGEDTAQVMPAERAGVPLLAVAGVYRLAQALVAGWKLDQAEHAASSGALGLAGRLHDGDSEVVSLDGALKARFLIDLARAQGQRRDCAGVTAALGRAAALTVEQVQYPPLAGELVVSARCTAVVSVSRVQ
jgi:hypothetical protein